MIETDYLVVGAGMAGMVFVDEMLTHSEARMVMVDRRPRAGGHWNEAYPFVRLHQPSVYYGAGSRELGTRRIETEGPNAGLFQQASGTEITAYFDQLMRERLLPSGRVRFLSLSDYVGNWSTDHRVVSRVTGEQTVVKARKVVDTTFYQVSTPATHTPAFEVGDGVLLIPPGALPAVIAPRQRYVVLGGGKTSMDVIVWLLEQGVREQAVTWVVPRDSWLVNRETAQPGEEGLLRMVRSQRDRLHAAAHASSLDDLYDRLETAGELLRVDRTVRPRMFHGATISPGELGLLRRVQDVVRAGHVQRIERGMMILDTDSRPAVPDAVYVDCTARGIHWGPTRPVFHRERITPQIIRDGRFSFSAAAIAYVEATVSDTARKNVLCTPIPYEEHLITLPRSLLTEIRNGAAWAREPALRNWARNHRLAGFGAARNAGVVVLLQRLRDEIASLRPHAEVNLVGLIAAHDMERGALRRVS